MQPDVAFEETVAALVAAFNDLPALDQMLRNKLGIQRPELVANGGIQPVVFELLTIAEANGWKARLIRAAHLAVPGNKLLAEVCRKYGRSSDAALQEGGTSQQAAAPPAFDGLEHRVTDGGECDPQLTSRTYTTAQSKARLIGIFKRTSAEVLRNEIALYAYAQIARSLSTDAVTCAAKCTITEIVKALETGDTPEGEAPRLWQFAVLCHDLAEQEPNYTPITGALREWIESECLGTEHTLDSIRSPLPPQSPGRIPRPAFEIAWPPPLRPGDPHEGFVPEVHKRWGDLREPVYLTGDHTGADRRHVVQTILEELHARRKTENPRLDHVEILVTSKDAHDLWEYKPNHTSGAHADPWQQFPICVRLLPGRPFAPPRACPNAAIAAVDIINHELPTFFASVTTTGVFVGGARIIDAAMSRAHIDAVLPASSIGLWSRSTVSAIDVQEFVVTLSNRRVEEIPIAVHGNRYRSTNGSVWRDVVLLFDPKLPPFCFTYDNADAIHQKETNADL